jgi:hypothetical protein
MHLSNVLVASVVAPLVAAHGGIPGAPKLFGLPRDLNGEVPTAPRVLRHAPSTKRGLLETRQGGQNGRCGPDFGGASCSAGYCCSGAVCSSSELFNSFIDVIIGLLRHLKRSLYGP